MTVRRLMADVVFCIVVTAVDVWLKRWLKTESKPARRGSQTLALLTSDFYERSYLPIA